MSTVQELSAYVASNPSDYEARWRLAKMLYMAWEYDDALKHLRVLRSEWDRRLNVRRYLAATLYRLGKYDEALIELEEIAEQWPREVPVLQQYARVLEVVGRADEAMATWHRILQIDPTHPLAKRIVERKAVPPIDADAVANEMRFADSSGGIDIRKGRICRNCGAQNGDEFDRCWQCHSALNGQTTAIPLPENDVKVATNGSPFWTFWTGISLVASLSAASYFISAYPEEHMGRAANVPASLFDALAQEQALARLVLWVVAAIVCPLCLALVLRFCGASPLPSGRILTIGWALATLAYVVTWLPLNLIGIAPLVVAGWALLVTFSFSQLGVGKLVFCWAAQVVAIAIVFGGVAYGFLGSDGVAEVKRVLAYAREHPEESQSSMSSIALTEQSIPAGWRIQWRSTGDPTIDRLAAPSTIAITGETDLSPLNVTLTPAGQAPMAVAGPPYEITLSASPAQTYDLTVEGQRGLRIGATVSGLLRASGDSLPQSNGMLPGI